MLHQRFTSPIQDADKYLDIQRERLSMMDKHSQPDDISMFFVFSLIPLETNQEKK